MSRHKTGNLEFVLSSSHAVSTCNMITMITMISSMFASMYRVTYLYVPFQSKWIYCGTDKGNVFTVLLEKFDLSGYVIYWNKTIDLCAIATYFLSFIHFLHHYGSNAFYSSLVLYHFGKVYFLGLGKHTFSDLES